MDEMSTTTVRFRDTRTDKDRLIRVTWLPQSEGRAQMWVEPKDITERFQDGLVGAFGAWWSILVMSLPPTSEYWKVTLERDQPYVRRDFLPVAAAKEVEGGDRVMRGCSWFYAACHVRCAGRDAYAPGLRYADYGFRLVANADYGFRLVANAEGNP